MTWTKRQPRPHRSEEFASHVSRPRQVARSTCLARLVVPLIEPVDPEPSSAAGRAHMGHVATLWCRLCLRLGHGPQPAEVHHIRTGQGAAQRASDFLTVPLCPDCHRGSHGIHGDRARLRQAKVTEMDLLADTIAALSR
jgi:hypothetical protein